MISNLRILFTLVMTLAATAAGAMSADTIISFVNFYPGADIYELEGHSVLRINMPQGDVAISYGTYDFEQPNFVYRFVKGETDYWVTALPWDYVEKAYSRQNRRIVEHRLNLSSQQKQRLIDLLEKNLQPENRTYRYNYVKDNCATRPLRMVESAVADSIILGEPDSSLAGEQTFRSLMRHYHRNYPWYQFGIDLALGSGIDYALTNREKSFAPVILDAQLTDAMVGDKKLVERTVVINDVAADAGIQPPTPWYLTPLTVSLAVMISVILITLRDMRRKRVSRWLDSLLFGLFGIAGCVIAFLVFISVHEATSPNFILLWLNPLCLIPAIFIWINRCKVIIFSYQIVNFVGLMILLVLAAAGKQVLNLAFYPLIIADAIRAINYIYLNTKQFKCSE